MAELFILRHGETHWNTEGRMQGGLDSPLTLRGRDQALHQGEILRDAGVEGLPLQCSPSGRAVQTAELALPQVTPVLDARLEEVRMGAWQGLTHDEIERRWPWAFEDPHPFLWKFTAPGGEALATMEARVSAWLADLSGPTIVVTHGVTCQLIRGTLLGKTLEQMADLEDRQGVVFHVTDQGESMLDLQR